MGPRRRRAACSYVPPHRRRAAGDAEAVDSRIGRPLEAVAGASRLEIELQCSPLHALDLKTSCPFDVRSVPSRGNSSSQHEQAATSRYSIALPKLWSHDDAEELLEWFSDLQLQQQSAWGGGGSACRELRLALPASLSKDERRVWHRTAETLRLCSGSRGVGDARYLTISLPNASAVDPDSSTAQRQREEAKKIWKWCQDEGGAMWGVSIGEIEEMLRSDAGLTPDIQQLCLDRGRAEELFSALRSGQEARCLEILSGAVPAASIQRLAWTKDSATGAYPVHLAVRKGMLRVVELLAAMPGVLSQKDRDRLTPFDVSEDMAVSELLCRIRAEGSSPN